MKTPVVLVAVSLAMAILLSASLLIATGARGEDAVGRISAQPQPQSACLPSLHSPSDPDFDVILIEKTWKTAASG
jgi:hypothetical protein